MLTKSGQIAMSELDHWTHTVSAKVPAEMLRQGLHLAVTKHQHGGLGLMMS